MSCPMLPENLTAACSLRPMGCFRRAATQYSPRRTRRTQSSSSPCFLRSLWSSVPSVSGSGSKDEEIGQLRVGSRLLAARPTACFGRGRSNRLQINRLKFLALDARANLLRGHFALGHDVGVMLFFGAGGALRAVGPFEA